MIQFKLKISKISRNKSKISVDTACQAIIGTSEHAATGGIALEKNRFMNLLAIQVGQNVRNLRKSNGLSTYELAEKLGISATSISNIENAKQWPSAPLLTAMADVLGCDVLDLFGVNRKDAIDATTALHVVAAKMGFEISRIQTAKTEKTATLVNAFNFATGITSAIYSTAHRPICALTSDFRIALSNDKALPVAKLVSTVANISKSILETAVTENVEMQAIGSLQRKPCRVDVYPLGRDLLLQIEFLPADWKVVKCVNDPHTVEMVFDDKGAVAFCSKPSMIEHKVSDVMGEQAAIVLGEIFTDTFLINKQAKAGKFEHNGKSVHAAMKKLSFGHFVTLTFD